MKNLFKFMLSAILVVMCVFFGLPVSAKPLASYWIYPIRNEKFYTFFVVDKTIQAISQKGHSQSAICKNIKIMQFRSPKRKNEIQPTFAVLTEQGSKIA